MAVERKFVSQNLKEFRIKEFVSEQLSRVGLSSIKLQRTPLGDKIIVKASRPGLVVGRAGSNIQKLTQALKEEFNLENPQIEIEEVEKIGLDANIIAEMIVNSLERFGSQRFKGVGHRALHDIMDAGALGAEILISGKIPSQRARTWRFYQGYLKKCGDVAISGVDVAYKTAVLKSGAVGVKVSIMPPTTILPDRIIVQEPDGPTVEEATGKDAEELAAKVAAATPDVQAEGAAAAPDEAAEEQPKAAKTAKKKAAKSGAEKKAKKTAKKETKKKEEKQELKSEAENETAKQEPAAKDAPSTESKDEAAAQPAAPDAEQASKQE